MKLTNVVKLIKKIISRKSLTLLIVTAEPVAEHSRCNVAERWLVVQSLSIEVKALKIARLFS